jgi:hypothetical protein
MFDAYRAGGASAELSFVAPFGADGHKLFSAGPTDLWWPMIAPFLARNGLPVEVVVPRAPVRLDPPPSLAASGREAFAAYLASESVEKAFAVGHGGWGSSLGRRTTREAIQTALEHCRAHATGECKVYAVGDAYAP